MAEQESLAEALRECITKVIPSADLLMMRSDGAKLNLIIETPPNIDKAKQQHLLEKLRAVIPDHFHPVVNFTKVKKGVSREQANEQIEDYPQALNKVRNIIAVGSGKGGVGKSTVALNLAWALCDLGYRVGLLDADVYGPSIPKMTGHAGQPDSDGKMMLPIEVEGMKLISIGNIGDEQTAAAWRGPMATSALMQLLTRVCWGELDFLFIDMPPGTGDIPLTLAQRGHLSGAVVVSTPQDLALADARKAMDLFRRLSVPILGIVENMSSFICPHCGEESAIFGIGGAEEEASSLNMPFLGRIPLLQDLRVAADCGERLELTVFEQIARTLLKNPIINPPFSGEADQEVQQSEQR